MSARNGDKSRFGRQRRQKIRRRKLNREVRTGATAKAAAPPKPA